MVRISLKTLSCLRNWSDKVWVWTTGKWFKNLSKADHLANPLAAFASGIVSGATSAVARPLSWVVFFFRSNNPLSVLMTNDFFITATTTSKIKLCPVGQLAATLLNHSGHHSLQMACGLVTQWWSVRGSGSFPQVKVILPRWLERRFFAIF